MMWMMMMTLKIMYIQINYIVKGQISNYASRWKNRYRFSHGSINTHQPIDQKAHTQTHTHTQS